MSFKFARFAADFFLEIGSFVGHSASGRFFIFAPMLLFTLGCSHFQSQSKGYRGLGDYKTPADYATAAENRDRETLAEPFAKNEPYSPRSPFRLDWPVRHVRINRGFKPPSDRRHQGVDLGGRRGTAVLAAHEGRVIYTGHAFHGYGNMILLEYNGHWATLYAHLDKIEVSEGDIVDAGARIGRMGRTGHATGVHLHFELLNERLPIDPLPYLSRVNRVAAH